MKIKEMLELTPSDIISVDERIDLEKEFTISINAMDCSENALLFFYRGIKEINYTIPATFNVSPMGIICDHTVVCDNTDLPLIKVKNTRSLLSSALYNMYNLNLSKMKFIGVTGTNGKTSTAYMLRSIFKKAGEKVGYIGTGKIMIDDEEINDKYYSMTTPDPLYLYSVLSKMDSSDCTTVIMEISSHSLSLSKVTPIKFSCGIFTNLSEEHLDFHGNMEDYYKTKLTLFKQSEIGIFNLDDPYSARAYREAECKKYSVGIINKGDAFITEPKYKNNQGCSYYYRETNLIFELQLHLSGVFNIYNSLIAAKAAIALGVKPRMVKAALGELVAIPGRYETIYDRVNVVIDYAHTPNAFENILNTLYSNKKSRQKLIVVFGCGGDRDKSKRNSMGSIAEKYSDFIIVTEDNSRSEPFDIISKNILAGISDKNRVTLIESRKAAIEYALCHADADDIVAILGKGCEPYILKNDKYEDFSDAEIVKSVLKRSR